MNLLEFLQNPRFLLDILQILVLPITLIAIILILRPFIRDLVGRMAKVQLRGVSFENTRSIAELDKETKVDFETRSKEELEKIRLALEAQQARQLMQYYALSESQSTIAFWFSIGAGTLGFMVIIVGVGLSLIGIKSSMAILSVGSGAIIDAVAALFFTQANRARRLMTDFFGSLRKDRQFNESLRLCESIPDSTIQSEIKAKLALFFAGVPTDALLGNSTEKVSMEAQATGRGSPQPTASNEQIK